MPAAHKSKPAAAKAAAPAAARPLKKGDHVFLVDGSGYIFRAYHALPPINRKSDGLQLNAVFGFCNMLWKLLRDLKPEERPTHLAVVFDKSEKTFRTEMYPDYKAHRPDPPDDLKPQFKYVREAVHAFDLPCLEQDGFEADDLIATYVREACEAGATATIVSSDKDLMQLVTGGVIMFDTMKDKKIGRAEVIEKFGVPPEKVIDVQALIGDSTDNVPGVPGIGVKTAAQLIGEYGDLETLLFRAPEIKQEKRRQSLIEHAEEARLSKKLVTLDDRVKLDVPIGDLAVHDPDYKRLVAFLKAMEFNSLMRRVAEFASVDAGAVEPEARFAGHARSTADILPSPLAGEGGAAPSAAPGEGAGAAAGAEPSPPRAARAGGGESSLPLTGGGMTLRTSPAGDRTGNFSATPQMLAAARTEAARNAKFDRSKYEAVRSLDRLNTWIERAREAGVVALDTATASGDPMQAELCGFSLAVGPNEACYVPLSHRQGGESEGGGLFRGEVLAGQIPERVALDALAPLFTDPGVLKIGYDLKFAWQIFALRGIEIASYDDVMLMSYALDAGRNSHALGPLAEHTFNHAAADLNALIKAGKSKITFDAVAIERATEYAAEKADIVFRLWLALKPRLVAERVLTVYETLERPLIAVLARMERRGISIDRDVLSRLSGEFAQEAASLEAEINELAGETVNPGSPKQLGDILYGKLGLAWRHQDQDRAMGDRRAGAGRAGRAGPHAAAEDPRLAASVEAEIDLHRRAAGLRQSGDASRPYQLRARLDHDRAAVVVRPQPAEHPGAHRGRPQDPPRLCRRAGNEARLRRLFADRAAASRRDRRHRALAESFPRRARHSCDDGVGNVRRADQGHAARSAPPRQGDQFRHRLRHLGLRPCQPARHSARRSRRLHQKVFRALPGHPRLYRGVQGLRQAARLRVHAVRPQMSLPRNPRLECFDPLVQRTRRRQCAAPRHRRRHHPPRHDPHGRGAGE